MCFSATASFIAGGALCAAGAVTLHEAKTKSRLPIAAMPLIFGVQQLVEGFVWIDGRVPVLSKISAFTYVMFSHVFWPSFLPFAVMSSEPPGRRKSILKGFVVLGVSISLFLFWSIIHGPVSASTAQRCVVYAMNLPDIPYGFMAYVFVTCFSCFFSSHKFIRVFGLALLGSFFIATWAYQEAFYSVWCFFAAILSFIIYVHLKLGPIPLKTTVSNGLKTLVDNFEK